MSTTIYSRYPEFVSSRAKKMPTHIEDLVHMSMGISGEAGELLDAVKKSYIYGKELDIENVIEELGDLLFYIQGMLNFLGVVDIRDLEDITLLNMRKLEKRYPQGYTDQAAIARADKKEGE